VGLRGKWLILPACLLWLRVPREAVAQGFCAEVERGLLLRSEDGSSSRLRRILHTSVLSGLGWRNITGWVQPKSILRHAEGSHHQPGRPILLSGQWRSGTRPGPAFYLRGHQTPVRVSYTGRWTPTAGRTFRIVTCQSNANFCKLFSWLWLRCQ